MPEELPPGSLPGAEPIDEPDQSAVLRHDTRARFWLAVLIVAQFVVLIAYIEFAGKELPDSQLLIGGQLGFISVILNYYFGSSASSTSKSASTSLPGKSGKND